MKVDIHEIYENLKFKPSVTKDYSRHQYISFGVVVGFWGLRPNAIIQVGNLTVYLGWFPEDE